MQEVSLIIHISDVILLSDGLFKSNLKGQLRNPDAGKKKKVMVPSPEILRNS